MLALSFAADEWQMWCRRVVGVLSTGFVLPGTPVGLVEAAGMEQPTDNDENGDQVRDDDD